MSISKIKPEDIGLLVRMFHLSKEVVVYDPKSSVESCTMAIVRDIATLLKESNSYEVCVNLSGKKLEFLPFNYILEFTQHVNQYKSFYCERFMAINNPDGSIRWLQPEDSERADFLSLYNGSGFKALLFKAVVKLAFYAGFKRAISSGFVCLYSKEEQYVQKRFGHKTFALFTGTVGKNRKAVAAICNRGYATHFIKIPISTTARSLIHSEHTHLEIINGYDFDRLIVPVSKMTISGLQLTNIRPQKAFSTGFITSLHLKALKDLYASTCQIKMLSDMDVFQKTSSRLSEIQRIKKHKKITHIPEDKINRLLYNIKVLIAGFDEKQLIPVAYAHGDFTPWNMFVSENNIHLYDWELAMSEQILLYDAFHFIFQSGVLIAHQSFDQINEKIKELKINEEVIDILERYKLDFRDCYCWYLVHNCSYYLNLYIQQENLHIQAFWLLDCWIDATTDAIKAGQLKVSVVG